MSSVEGPHSPVILAKNPVFLLITHGLAMHTAPGSVERHGIVSLSQEPESITTVCVYERTSLTASSRTRSTGAVEYMCPKMLERTVTACLATDIHLAPQILRLQACSAGATDQLEQEECSLDHWTFCPQRVRHSRLLLLWRGCNDWLLGHIYVDQTLRPATPQHPVLRSSFNMVHLLCWPETYFFYPIGNTSAVCLTRDLAPEESANILLLGCGDPRNVMYTIFCESDESE